jgi:hypothetical protein
MFMLIMLMIIMIMVMLMATAGELMMTALMRKGGKESWWDDVGQ